MKNIVLCLLASLAVVCNSCTPLPSPGVRLACDKLTALHCAEGMPGCYGVLQSVIVARLTPVPLGCIVGAATKEAARACGKFVTCP